MLLGIQHSRNVLTVLSHSQTVLGESGMHSGNLSVGELTHLFYKEMKKITHYKKDRLRESQYH